MGSLLGNKTSQLFVGTSGFSYQQWKGNFYPKEIKTPEMLGYYAQHLSAVELNNTFYRLPKRDVVASWSAQVSNDFRFVIKASRRITHFSRLKNCDDLVNYLVSVLEPLESKLGAVLFQLPPNFSEDASVLAEFLQRLPADLPVAFEFRHESWKKPKVFDLLRDRNAAWCHADTGDDSELPTVTTADWGYVRLRRETYSDGELKLWKKYLVAQNWTAAFAFFKHESLGPKWADELRRCDPTSG